MTEKILELPEENFKNWDRTGPGPRKISKPGSKDPCSDRFRPQSTDFQFWAYILGTEFLITEVNYFTGCSNLYLYDCKT